MDGSTKETVALLDEIGIDVFSPETRREELLAESFEAFSRFVLEEKRDWCLGVIEKDNGNTVGALQGGSEEFEVYRAVIADDHGAAAQWMREFHAQHPNYQSVFTTCKLQQYMLQMCDRRSNARGERQYTKLGNFMFILAFGPANGQVRHIDSMNPNVQLCLYMSNDCPSTVVYSLEDPPITNAQELLEHWETTTGTVPSLIQTILAKEAKRSLKSIWHAKYFGFWDTIDQHLLVFGKLYQAVSKALSLTVDPGTMLIAGGNEVHSGPKTNGPRLFAFAIGIPDAEQQEEAEAAAENDEDRDGEVQYTPLLAHVDLCCILFGFMDLDYYYHADRQEEHLEAKRYLLSLLLPFVREYPQETYARLLGDDRAEVRSWLAKLVEVVGRNGSTDSLFEEAIASDTMFYSPGDVKKRRAKLKRLQKKTAKASIPS